jgi:hypothetical protein
MFTLLILFVVALAIFVGINLINGPMFGARRGGRTIVIDRDPPVDTVIEREVPRQRVVERVVEREYDA